ncbi:MAG: acylphosphatase [Acidobacteria bacterium]|nr:acylphosphatase [Acidobacteriota bacterium]MBU1338257.1 acylphosphatase [Acidobacteriota bacterium]MBU1475076.1 acylphosphatase [Acidobacteriota bacterium]
MPGHIPSENGGKKDVKARAHIFVSGRVQGVFFRDHSRRWAADLRLYGWTRNLQDGRVEVCAEGEKEHLTALIDRLRQGSPLSLVENVDVFWQDYQNEFTTFRIIS